MTDREILRTIDLNLLLALDALIDERSVTKAAVRTGIGQSGMSSALGRLRRLFDDELLVRGADGMHLTPRTMQLAEPLRSVLRQIRSLVEHSRGFDPATALRTFTIAVLDASELLLLPQLLAHFTNEAPGLELVVRPFERSSYAADLDADRIDLAIGFSLAGHGHHKQKLLYRDHYVAIYNRDLLDIEPPITLADYVRIPHVVTSYAGTSGGAVDEALAEGGATRQIATRTPRFLVVPHLVRSAPVLATMGARLAALLAHSQGLTTSPLPVKVAGFATNMVWHVSYDEDPGHTWLRATLIRIAQELPQPA